MRIYFGDGNSFNNYFDTTTNFFNLHEWLYFHMNFNNVVGRFEIWVYNENL